MLQAGFGQTSSDLYAALAATQAQSRLATVSGSFLDLAARDFRGTTLIRRADESDTALRARLLPIFRDAGTRPALIATLTRLTGQAPWIFEPGRPADTGGWDVGGMAYDQVGGWGGTDTPFQVLVQAARPGGGGVPGVGGFDAPGGFDVGGTMWIDDTMVTPHVTDHDIYDAIVACVPAGVIAWVQLTSGDAPGVAPLDLFALDLNQLA